MADIEITPCRTGRENIPPLNSLSIHGARKDLRRDEMGIELVTRPQGTCSTFEGSLREAVMLKRLSIEFQPKISLQTGHICGAEALARWTHPALGAVPPSDFIPLAEAYGLIGAIGEWVIEQSCALIATANREGMPPLRIAINLSPLELIDPALPRRLKMATQSKGVDIGSLELEISEAAILSDLERATAALRTLRGLGLTIAVDRVGFGPSCLAHLRTLPIDVLKLGRDFIAKVDDSQIERRIIGTVAALGHAIGLTVVAEGVERATQADLLVRSGIDIGQGFYYGHPMVERDFLSWLTPAPAPTAVIANMIPPHQRDAPRFHSPCIAS
jgi:EAL domain-containing protein (putative c-di-GMP-specific phosphodiesterase class I)